MKKGDHVQVRKLAPIDTPSYPSGDPLSYQYGKDNLDVSVPDDYTVKGHFMADVEVGAPAKIKRYERNGKKIDGMMVTSPVKSILANRFYTGNSVYEVMAI